MLGRRVAEKEDVMRNTLVLLAGIVLLASRVGVVAQSKSGSIPGVWQTVEVNIAGANPRTITIPKPGPWLTIFTAKHYSRTEVQSEAPRPILADVAKATADELRTVWGPLVAEAGTYEVSGNTLTMHPVASKSPAAMAPGAFIVSSYQLDGDSLTIAQQRNQSGPYASPVTFKLVRIE
jgi:hypothetical protein